MFNLKNVINSLLLFGIFFQAVGFIPGSDTQPTFFLLGILTLVFTIRSTTYCAYSLITVCIVLGFLFISFLVHVEFIDFSFVATYLIAVLLPFIIFTLLQNDYLVVDERFIIKVTLVYSFVGFIQLFVPDFLSFLVTRSEEAALSFSDSGRGVRSLTGEPQYLGKIYILLNILYVFLITQADNIRGYELKRKIAIMSVAFFILNVILARSFYSMTMHLLVLGSLLFFYNKSFLVKGVCVLAVIVLMVYKIDMSAMGIRIIDIAYTLASNPEAILQQGAMKRVMNISLSLNSLELFGIFGAGNDPAIYETSITTPVGTLYYVVGNRGFGGVVEFIMKFGVLSTTFIAVYFYILYSISRRVVLHGPKKYRLGILFSVLLFIISFQDGSPAKPLVVFVVMYIFVKLRHREHHL